MHFTPQYGDSFIEELRLLLKDSRFLEVEKLRKVILSYIQLFLVCEPFYGHVLSFLKLNHWHPHMPSLKYSIKYVAKCGKMPYTKFHKTFTGQIHKPRRGNLLHTFRTILPMRVKGARRRGRNFLCPISRWRTKTDYFTLLYYIKE